MERTIRALWFNADHDHNQPRKRQMDWLAVRPKLEDIKEKTIIGWLWLQRRGPHKIRPAKLIAEIGSGIEIYRKPSVLTRSDIQPMELIDWTKPAERNLSQLGLTRKSMAENPFWDVWVRLAPPENPSMVEMRRAERYIADKTEADRFERERVARAEAWKTKTQAERDMEDFHHLSYGEQLELQREHQMQNRTALVEARREYRASLVTAAEQREADRLKAIEIHRERIEAGRARALAATMAPRKLRTHS